MNLENYISSGILESYVLGELSQPEMKEVEANAQKYPQIREELKNIEDVFFEIANSNAKAPLPGTKEALFSRIEALEQSTSTSTEAKVVSIDSATNKIEKSGRGLMYYAAASAAIAVISTVLAITFYSRWQNSENQLATVIAENSRLATNYNTVNQDLTEAQRDLAIVNQEDFKRIDMKGLEIAPNSLARIYWNENSQEVYLNVANLPSPPTGKQYQLWAIVDGKPVDAGVFDPQQGEGLIQMKPINNASAFAVTLEPQGGSESPTMDAMYVMGNVNEA